MKNRFKKISVIIITSIVLVLTACTPSTEDIRTYLSEGNYDKVYDYLVTSIEDQTASISDFDNDQKTTFETSLFGLLSSSSEYRNKAGELISQHHSRIEGHKNLEPLLWAYLSEHQTAPKGVYQYLYERFDFENPDEQSISKIRSDSSFLGLLKAVLSETIHNNIFNLDRIGLLADVGNIKSISSNIDEIARLQRYKNAVEQEIISIEKKEDKANQRTASRRYQNLNRKERIEEEIKELKRELSVGLKESFILRAYMVALIDQFTIDGYLREVYEVHDYSGNVIVLITTETSFSSKGTFSMRVIEFLDLPMKFKQQYGGFNTSIKSYVEVSSSNWEDYVYTKSKIEDLEFEMEMLSSESYKSTSNSSQSINSNLSNLKDQFDSYSDKISNERQELVRWANNNSGS